jgi:hypothetical protein
VRVGEEEILAVLIGRVNIGREGEEEDVEEDFGRKAVEHD